MDGKASAFAQFSGSCIISKKQIVEQYYMKKPDTETRSCPKGLDHVLGRVQKAYFIVSIRKKNNHFEAMAKLK